MNVNQLPDRVYMALTEVSRMLAKTLTFLQSLLALRDDTGRWQNAHYLVHLAFVQEYAKSLVTLVQAEDVDKLLDEYEAQAKADSTAAEQKLLKLRNKRQKSMKEVRQEGLDAPIASDNKYGALAYLTLPNSDDRDWAPRYVWQKLAP